MSLCYKTSSGNITICICCVWFSRQRKCTCEIRLKWYNAVVQLNLCSVIGKDRLKWQCLEEWRKHSWLHVFVRYWHNKFNFHKIIAVRARGNTPKFQTINPRIRWYFNFFSKQLYEIGILRILRNKEDTNKLEIKLINHTRRYGTVSTLCCEIN